MGGRCAKPRNIENSVGGTNQLYIAGFFRNSVLAAITEAERIKGGPASMPEIAAVFQHDTSKFFNQSHIFSFMQNLYREDTFYADSQFLLYSLTGPDGSEARESFETFSERFRRLFKGYELDR